MEAAAMTAGPVRNLTAMANVATEFPHAMIFGCKAINRPFITKKKKKKKLVATTKLINLNSTVFTPNYPYYYIYHGPLRHLSQPMRTDPGPQNDVAGVTHMSGGQTNL